MTLMDPLPRETTLESGGTAKGVAVAVVRENKDDSGLGRVKVSYPWYSEQRESYWARVATAMAGKQRGTYFIPEVGDEVLVAFDRGDLRFPYVIGCLWNGSDKSPAVNDDGKNNLRVIRTRKGHRLTFNDSEDQGLVQLELNDGKMLSIDDHGMRLDDKKGNSVVINSDDNAITVQSARRLSLKGVQVSIEASGTIDIKAGATLSINGTLVKIN
jgi:uncharacterized protein involved in type VI secretion and phage assembly